MMERRACPPPAIVERAYWTARGGSQLDEREVPIHDHVAGCERCRDVWMEIETLAAVGATIEPAPSARGEELRTTLLSAMDNHRETPSVHVFDWRRILIAPAAIAAALVVWWAWPAQVTPPPTVTVATHRGVVLEHEGARVRVVSEQPDEIVRLASGTITVTVPVLAANERFRVVTGDDEIDAGAAAFDASAQQDRLTSVRVLHGEVKLLAQGTTKIVRAGETWRATTQLAVVTADARVEPAPPSRPKVVVEVPRPEAAPRDVGSVPATTPPVDAPPTDGPPIDASPVAPRPARSVAQQALDAGWTAMRAGNYLDAAAAFERVNDATVDPNQLEDATFWRGAALGRAGEVASAVRVLSTFTRAYPRSARLGDANVILAWLYFERGDHADAKRHFEGATKDASVRVREAARKGLAELARRRP
jgi:TolA-binding protein